MTKAEAFEAFNNLVKDFSSSKTFKFCFFIDGLDELDEENDTTHSAIVSILGKWTDMSAGSVKICVSSRHFPVFEDMPVHHRIRLQDLTKYDIINFVRNSLVSHQKSRSDMKANTMDYQKLVNSISERADGVFLWVSLVVRSVERGLSNADPIVILRERVKSTPRKLELLFKSLLDSIEGCHAQLSFLLLALAMAGSMGSADYFYDLSLSECGEFFQAFERSKTSNIDTIFCVGNTPEAFELPPEAITSIKSKVLFRCKGLLEIVSAKGERWKRAEKFFGARVSFLHRSIAEFLKMWIPKQMSAHGLSSVHVHNAACWMLWAQIESLNSTILNALIERGADINDEVLECCGRLAVFSSETGGLPSVFDAMWITALFGKGTIISIKRQRVAFDIIELLLDLGAICRSVVYVGRARDWFRVTHSQAPHDGLGESGAQLGEIKQIPGAACARTLGKETTEYLRMICGQDDGIITLEKWVAYAKPQNMTTILSLIERDSCAEEARSSEARDLSPVDRLHTAMFYGLRGNNKLVWCEYDTSDSDD
ncbi:hypothetical protein Daus18300_011986 [Diaporthe australafricana]|uniref:DUF7791 domain-containing protein n=1 Tax=Diaporthe australafricana TaxID=127596 RepID=A0ABR3W4L4_9PEZI